MGLPKEGSVDRKMARPLAGSRCCYLTLQRFGAWSAKQIQKQRMHEGVLPGEKHKTRGRKEFGRHACVQRCFFKTLASEFCLSSNRKYPAPGEALDGLWWCF